MVKAAGLKSASLPGISTTALHVFPNDEGTADCRYFCLCDDGSDYAVKNMDEDARIPHSEWFGTYLGERVGLLSPPANVVIMGGEECFGSRWETGLQPDWWIMAKAGAIAFDQLAGALSRILAFDLFIHNDDRHLRNYIVRRQRTKHTVLAFDYSRAWLCNGVPPPPIPMGSDTQTIRTYRYLRETFGPFLSNTDVNHVLDGLGKTTIATIQHIIASHPEKWLTQQEKSAILSWWQSSARLERIAEIKEGMNDESIL